METMGTLTNEPVNALLLDDSEDDIVIMRHLLRQYRAAVFEVIAETRPMAALRDLERHHFDVLILDYSMPGTNGIEFLQEASALHQVPPTVMVTGQSDHHLVTLALRAGAADCLNKHELTARTLGETISRVLILAKEAERTRAHEGVMLERLAEAATLLEPTISAMGVAYCSLLLGHALGLREKELELLRFGALAHDIGKLGVEASILSKAGALAQDEAAAMQMHTLLGAQLCSALHNANEVAPIVRSHHEWWDGSGYPDGLASEEIPYFARIVSVADAFEAMAANRPYRAALEMEQIRHEFLAGAGKQWDPHMVKAFLATHPLLRQ
jgi:putative nucleotidyltransferase with HDIG domain